MTSALTAVATVLAVLIAVSSALRCGQDLERSIGAGLTASGWPFFGAAPAARVASQWFVTLLGILALVSVVALVGLDLPRPLEGIVVVSGSFVIAGIGCLAGLSRSALKVGLGALRTESRRPAFRKFLIGRFGAIVGLVVAMLVLYWWFSLSD